ncbi:peptidoglycan endopeptidase [Deinococcus marmoris]|uniref:Cell wall-associated hydrolases (Invasion-associated proteins) n=1 Tax=Deinococcus marmoris TaxID=249408 RepID=A0A1U7NYI9_9DEIO|nr:peptidoglycan endopeptidase [Deinococcus marmoris]OLV17970.1 Cell wall-associated hydrolases (invasion-associated proteins) [Deinococcus marmoris]
MPQPSVVPSVPALILSALLSLGGLAGAQTGGFQGMTVTVQAKDTAYAVAKRAGLSVDALLALNGLHSPDLKVGQVLRVSSAARHVVGPKETLYAISKRYRVSVDALLAENTLPEGAILSVGQVLLLPTNATLPSSTQAAPVALAPTPGPLAVVPVLSLASTLTPPPVLSVPQPPEPLPVQPVPSQPLPSQPSPSEPLPVSPVSEGPALPTPGPAVQEVPSTATTLPGDWRGMAMALLGTPYRYGGTTRSGLDCSGFVLQVFAPLGVRLPRVSADQARVGQPVAADQLQPGDLVFFDTAGGGRISHVGIYLGGDTFVSANSYQGKVSLDTLMADRYWAPRYRGARRVLSGPYAGQAP